MNKEKRKYYFPNCNILKFQREIISRLSNTPDESDCVGYLATHLNGRLMARKTVVRYSQRAEQFSQSSLDAIGCFEQRPDSPEVGRIGT